MTITSLETGAGVRKIVEAGLQWALPNLMTRGNLSALGFPVMKALPAFQMLRQAAARGEISPGSLIVETSSGSFAYGLAQVCKVLGYRLRIVTDASVNGAFADGLRALGAELDIVDAPRDASNVQQLRMDRLQQIITEEGAYWPRQYDNLDNALAYAPAAEIVARDVGRVTDLVAAVGSGGSSQGLIRYLRQLRPNTRLIATDTFGSVLFGLHAGRRDLRGLGNSLHPKNVFHHFFDEVHWVDAPTAYAGVSEIKSSGYGDFGPTSGAAFTVARWIARNDPSRHVLVIFPDSGTRYRGLISSWAASNPRPLVPNKPHHARVLREVRPPWSRLLWGRRTLDEVLRLDPAEVLQ